MAGSNLLTTDEVLLLENLMYLTDKSPFSSVTNYEGKTVGDMLNKIDISSIADSSDYGSYMTGSDWKELISAIQGNDDLMNMRIATTHVDTAEGGGGGTSAVFVNNQSGEAIVAFRGTAGNEWKDNFVGGGSTGDPIDGVSTTQQRNALEWYQETYNELGLDNYSVTVTGHSKGGNKAKYITILDGTVDRCISFDGQGFSDEFYEEYAIEIGAREGVIENHNVKYDYVNLLLNDVGNTTYYEGYDYGSAGFLENHCPNTFFNFDENGNYSLTPVNGRPEEIQQLDEFLNSYLRSMPGEDKVAALALVGQMVESFFATGDEITMDEINGLINELSSQPGCEDTLAYLLAYVVEYGQQNPKFFDSISGIMAEFGLADMIQYVEMVEGIMSWKYFDLLYDLVNGAVNDLVDNTPGFLWDLLFKFVEEKWGVKLSKKELLQLVKIIGLVNENMDDIQIKDGTGKDKKSEWVGAIGSCQLTVQMNGLAQGVTDMYSLANRLRSEANRVNNVRDGMRFADFGIKMYLINLERLIEKDLRICSKMSDVLEKVADSYNTAEKSICEYVG